MPVARNAPVCVTREFDPILEYTKRFTTACDSAKEANDEIAHHPNPFTHQMRWTEQLTPNSGDLGFNSPLHESESPAIIGEEILNVHDNGTQQRSSLLWMSCLRASGAESPATDLQTSKLTPVHSDVECFMHHKETDYGHHKHYSLQTQFHYSTYTPEIIERPTPIGQETHVIKDIGNSVEGRSTTSLEKAHFKDDYPLHHHYHFHQHHHFHHHHHHSFDPNPTLDLIKSDSNELDSANHSKDPHGMRNSPEFGDEADEDLEEAWCTLQLKVLRWLREVQPSKDVV